MTDADIINDALDELAEAGWDIPTELEALAWAAKEGDEVAGWEADALARRAEWEES